MDVSVWKPERAEGPLPVVYLNVFQGDGAPVWEACQEAGCPPFALVAVGGLDWNRDLSPWGCEATTRSNEPFAGGAREHLEKLLSEVIPQIEDGLPWPVAWRGIAGYSLAGLFALWSLWETPVFSRVASVSGSLWFPGFAEYLDENLPQGALDVAYLSLGKKEHKTPNRMMREVLADTKRCEQTLQDRGAKTLFECNPGNHFSEPALRSAKGIAWMLAQ